MEDSGKLKKRICHKVFFNLIILIIVTMNFNAYAIWYEEKEIVELEKEQDFWWLPRKKRQEKIDEINKINEEKLKNRKTNTKWIYSEADLSKYPKDKWELIDDNNDGILYNYYFDKDGYLYKNTITPDYKIVDERGREVDYNLIPIKYEKNNDINKGENGIVLDKSDTYNITKEPAKVLIGKGVILKEKQKIYDNSIDKNAFSYVINSNRFIKDTKGIIYSEIKWKNCCSIKGNGGFVEFENPKNNFNKIVIHMATEYYTYNDDSTICTLKVYDADKYKRYNENHILNELAPIFETNTFNRTDAKRYEFVFDRSIKSLRFEIETEGEHTNRICYLNDFKFGFNKTAFIEELERKKEEEEEIRYLKELGIYIDDFSSLVALDEEGNEIEEDEEEDEDGYTHIDENDGYSYHSDESDGYSYEDKVRDRMTGPAFDEDLKNAKDDRNFGPAFIEENKS